MKQKIIAAVLAAAMLVPAAARAEEWIELSAWGYNEVSGFISDGLMPEMLKGKGNYKQLITRGEFAELIYSVMDKTGMIMSTVDFEPFSDCDGYTGAQKLGSLGVAEGVAESGAEPEFEPEKNITREDAAVMLSRAVQISFNTGSMYAIYDFSKIQERYDDIDELSDYAINPVRYMFQYNIMEGDDENRRFDPKGNLTIEQAVLMVYRYYKAIPRVIESDNEGTREGDVIKQFDGGLTEVYENNTYCIRDEYGTELMSFEADVYSSLLCCGFGGERLCFAVNFNDNTDVYNLDTRECKYTIPNIVYDINAEKGYAYTYSGRFMPVFSGMWNMKGYLAIPPCYSRSEVDELIAVSEEMGIEVYPEPTPAPAADVEADGMVYYTTAESAGSRLCSIDSNGNNRKVLVDEPCSNLMYINGTLYFTADKDGVMQLYCIDPAGGEKEWICAGDKIIIGMPLPLLFYEECGEDYLTECRAMNSEGNMMSYFAGNASRSVLNDGVLLYEMAYGDFECRRLYMARLTENGAEKIPLADFPVYRDHVTAPYDGSGRIFFTEYEKMYNNGSSPLYMYDGAETKIVSGDYNVITYGFKKTPDGTPEKDRIYFTADELDGKCAYADLNTGEITVYTPEGDPEDSLADSGNYTPDNYFIAYNENGLEVDTRDTIMRITYNGETTEMQRMYFKTVIGDYIYYLGSPQTITVTGSLYTSFAVRRIRNNPLYAYNYKTGESVVVAEDYYSDAVGGSLLGRFGFRRTYLDILANDADRDIFIYCSNLGEYKEVRGDHAVTVYPNKGIHKYGSVYAVGEITESSWDEGWVYKVDKDGNMSHITQTKAECWVYVQNGETTPKFAHSTYMW